MSRSWDEPAHGLKLKWRRKNGAFTPRFQLNALIIGWARYPSSKQSAARQCNLGAHEDAGLESVADRPRTLLRYSDNVPNFATTSRRWQRTSASRLCKESVV